VWQDFDLAPMFPVLRRFLGFWQHELDGKLHSVKVACTGIGRSSPSLPISTMMYRSHGQSRSILHLNLGSLILTPRRSSLAI
jgi:hypothetical protein